MRSIFYASVLLLLFCTQLFATVYIEKDGLFFYFPEDEKAIAERLTEKAPQMVDFLARKGLEFKTPLHIIVDSKMDAPKVDVHVIPHREIRRPPKLFPVRGFDSNLVEAPKAAGAGIEVYWPLANLQKGYQTLPLFLHRLRIGTFVDAGIAGEDATSDDWIVGAGFEFITSLEIAWGNFSTFRMGMAGPVVYPDFVKDDNPKFFFQLGRPL
ncbi:MAG TPA: hypothetical protein VMW06_06190 [Desulfobacterales bacterium]|nr:hypothetical protein [Desulfobacterales bacterium]